MHAAVSEQQCLMWCSTLTPCLLAMCTGPSSPQALTCQHDESTIIFKSYSLIVTVTCVQESPQK